MFIDAHAHLDKYGDQLEAALKEIEERRIFTWAVSMDIASYRRSLEIAAQSEWVLPTFGIHPTRAPEYAADLKSLGSWIERSPALGEIGLDYHWVKNPGDFSAQKKVFEYFLAAAREQSKVVNLHTKGAEKDILDLLEHYQVRRAVVHWYSGPLDILRALVEFGAHFTFGVELLSSDKIRELARAVPLRQILTETDNPGGLKWLTGEIGMPDVILRVVEALADVKEMAPEMLAKAVERNFKALPVDRFETKV
ncbi:MAG TPA: TatD family hydrolase [Verrucomicrobiae bacterium]|jgi:TatD DNase family protein|nr:TatD family hydrolase [Verrucomicrobiae bacterium]